MANTFELIASSTVGSGGAANIEFTSIPSTYTDLCLKLSLRTLHNNTPDDWYLRVNGISSSVYSYIYLQGNGSTASSGRASSTSLIYVPYTDSDANTTSTYTNIEMYFPNYANTSTHKSISIDGVYEQNGTTAYSWINAGLYSQTTAISSINCIPYNANWKQYSTAYLYGIKNS
jgi:hypothetical protein